MEMEQERRFIEDRLPLEDISAESAKEKNRRKGNLSTLHVWWARRPLIPCRAAIFGSLVRNSDSKNSNDEMLKRICTWEASVDRSRISPARKMILDNYGGRKPRILDCFAGGGAIPLEALRLGCEICAVELNPVAHLIELGTLVLPYNSYQKRGPRTEKDMAAMSGSSDLLKESIVKWGKWVYQEAQKSIGSFYPKSSSGLSPIAYLWSRAVPCANPRCSLEVPLVRQTWLSRKPGESFGYEISVEGDECKFIIKNVTERGKFKGTGTMRRGTVKCPKCEQTMDAHHLRKCGIEGLMKEIPIVTVIMNGNRRKFFIPFTESDIEAFELAQKALEHEKTSNLNWIPEEQLPPVGTLGFRVQRYGFRKWSQLFNPRQLLAIITFGKLVSQAKTKMIESGEDENLANAVVTYLAFAVDRLADRNSSFCTWNAHASALNVGNTFGRQALPMVWDYAESNPFNVWDSSIERITQFIDRETKVIEESAKVILGSATSLPFENDYFDAVITDPPYYNAVPYADLSDFFYVWLKRTVGDIYPTLFTTPLSPKRLEIIQEPKRHHGDEEEAKSWYRVQMTNAFKEVNRVLRGKGIAVIVFAHKSTAAWETLVNSLLEADLTVTASWPLRTERPGRLRAQQSAALASSIFIVCRKRLSQEDGYFDEIKAELAAKVRQRLDEFWKRGIRGADFFISAIGPAVEVFGKYKRVKRLSGAEVKSPEFLDTVREIVTDYSLRKILHEGHLGDIDEITRFYVLWRWAYNDAEIEFDDARKLAQALGAETDELMNKMDLLRKKGEKVKILGAKERDNMRDLGEPKGTSLPPMIDVIHRACLLWEKGEKNILQEYLSANGYESNETIWSAAQALSEILPEGNKEKQLIQGLLAAKRSIIGTAQAKGQTTLPSFKEMG
jgi:putative DNA methylase